MSKLAICVVLVKKHMYGSTSYLRTEQVLNWPLIYKVNEQLHEKRSRGVQKAYTVNVEIFVGD